LNGRTLQCMSFLRLNYWGMAVCIYQLMFSIRCWRDPSFLNFGQSLNCLINLPLLLEPEGSLPCSQKSTTGPYSEPDECSAYPPKCSNYFHGRFFAPLQVRYGNESVSKCCRRSGGAAYVQQKAWPLPASCCMRIQYGTLSLQDN
jgi:hypothetical protein